MTEQDPVCRLIWASRGRIDKEGLGNGELGEETERLFGKTGTHLTAGRIC
jgi:hypothetical protein